MSTCLGVLTMRNNVLKNLDNRLQIIEQHLYNESKQVGNLYHVCSLEAYLNYIVPTNTLSASGKYTNWLYGGTDYVSFTRDKRFIVDSTRLFDSNVILQLVIDGDKLSNKYSIKPYNDFMWDYDGTKSSDDDNPKFREREEVVKGPIRMISKYIKQIYFDASNIDEATVNDLKEIVDDNVEYMPIIKSSMLAYSSKNQDFMSFKRENLNAGDSLEKAINVFENYIASKEGTQLRDMLFSGNIDEVRQAVYSGVGFKTKNNNGQTAIVFYCMSKNSGNIIRLLLENGANQNEKSKTGTPVLSLAIKFGNIDAVNELLKHSPNVNEADKYGVTPLMYAVKLNLYEVADKLIANGANTKAVDNRGRSVKDYAIGDKMLKIIDDSI